MIEVSLQALGFSVEEPKEDSKQARFTALAALFLPFAAPGGDGPIPLPAVAVHFGMSREAVEDVHSQLGEVLDKMPKTSVITTATSMADAERIAQMDRQFKGP
jgi:hypothetical protein